MCEGGTVNMCMCVRIMHKKYRSVCGYVNEVGWSGYQPSEK